MSESYSVNSSGEEAQLLTWLASRDPAEADAAIMRVLHAGRGMIPALLTLRGHTEPFTGYALLNPRASILLPVPTPGFEIPESQKYRVITVEAAALYLISAIHYGELHFSQAPLLMDPTEPKASRIIANTPERIAKAFDAAQQWVSSGGALRPAGAQSDPIAHSGLRWY